MTSIEASEGARPAAYRPDVDGLRAVAVLAVVAFHAFPAAAPGGFVGVDVFFVISGFLITGILAREHDRGLRGLVDFYARRARRILPALTVMVLTVTAVGAAVLIPVDLERMGQSAAYLAAIVSNQYFRLEADYFGPAAHEQVLLHTWSLSIEEQFYLAWPALMLVLLHPRARRFAPIVVGLIVAASLAQSQVLLRTDPPAAFYQLNSRAWELALGALVALWPARLAAPERWRPAMGATGLAMIGLAVAVFGPTTGFPGLAALLPCVGTALVLAAGGQGPAGRLLAWRPAVGVGLISYSLYLWHWPLLIVPGLALSRALTPLETGAAVAAAFLAAWASWRWVERPARRWGHDRPWASLAAGAAAICVLGGVGVALAVTDGLPGRARPEVLRAQSAWRSVQPLIDVCHVRHGAELPDVEACSLGPSPRDVIVWGDSHASHLAPLVEAVAAGEGRGMVEITKSACPPLPLPGVDADCLAFNRNMLALLADRRPRSVVIVGRWAQYWRGADRDTAGFAAAVERGLTEVRAALGPGVKLIIWGPAAEFEIKPSLCWARRAHVGLDPAVCETPEPVDAAGVRALERALTDAAARVPGVEVVLPFDAFCPGGRCAVRTPEGEFIYRDADHLTVPGALAYRELLEGRL